MEHDDLLRETCRLTLENNKLLHKMRRNAFVSGIVKFALYLLVLVVIPLWLYSTYLQPLVQSLQQTMSQVQGTSAQVQTQFGSLQDAWKQIESLLLKAGGTPVR